MDVFEEPVEVKKQVKEKKKRLSDIISEIRK